MLIGPLSPAHDYTAVAFVVNYDFGITRSFTVNYRSWRSHMAES